MPTPAVLNRGARWAVLAVVVGVLVATPSLVARLPARDSPATAPELLSAVRASAELPYSGYAESVGGVSLPQATQLSSLTDLFGDTTRTRSWYRGPQQWRVDTLSATGETDLYRDAGGTWSWDFESDTAVRSVDLAVRLPRAADLVPPALGRRLLSEATDAEVTRLPAARVAGRDAPGLQLHPADPRSTIAAVDVWVDPGTGIPLRVVVHAVGAQRASLSSSFLEFTPAEPAAGVTTFTPPPGATVRTEQPDDLVAAAQQAGVRTPDRLAGLPRRTGLSGVGADGGLGVYGRGVTTVIAVAVPGRTARQLRAELTTAPGALTDSTGTTLAVDPLTVRLTAPGPRGLAWLLVGTVTADPLAAAAAELAAVRLR
ncbi:hypothetical protein [Rhodococcus sp. X156]|uniref:LolA family protein n=1 Tax=Rhodococcus sp. X156 TaxID=2499145 RepID=UPI0019CFA4EB|nr:hypothetical protein [Rhodococcus sp. X156]